MSVTFQKKGRKKYNNLYVHETGPEIDRDHIKNGTGTNELDQGVDNTKIEERNENNSANDSIRPLNNRDGGNGTDELQQNNRKFPKEFENLETDEESITTLQ